VRLPGGPRGLTLPPVTGREGEPDTDPGHSRREDRVVFLRLTLSLALIYYRRFYRRKYDAARTLRAFSSKLREETDLDRLGGELVSVVR
jgi:hypothetical protein